MLERGCGLSQGDGGEGGEKGCIWDTLEDEFR